ncbi:MAG: hypothetical protein K6F99_07745 [Lachnospiraceae bacterium]|nr:hypothetical protein [Lachnospiraceae bacterium]
MSIRKTLLMLTINYIEVIIWLILFQMGAFEALVLFPVDMFAVAFNYILLNGKKEVRFWCMNLLAANLLGIGLSTYMRIMYLPPDRMNMFIMIFEMVTITVILIIASVISGRMNQKKVNRLNRQKRRMPDVEGDSDINEAIENSRPLEIRRPLYEDMNDLADEDEEGYDEEDEEDEDDEAKYRMIVKNK